MNTEERLQNAEATIAALQQQVRDQQTAMAQIAANSANSITAVNGLKVTLEKLTTGIELLVADYTEFKAQTVQRVSSLIASAPRKPAPPPHGMN